jgi:hypothetical protein
MIITAFGRLCFNLGVTNGHFGEPTVITNLFSAVPILGQDISSSIMGWLTLLLTQP